MAGIFLFGCVFLVNTQCTVDTGELLLWEEESLTVGFGDLAQEVVFVGLSSL